MKIIILVYHPVSFLIHILFRKLDLPELKEYRNGFTNITSLSACCIFCMDLEDLILTAWKPHSFHMVSSIAYLSHMRPNYKIEIGLTLIRYYSIPYVLLYFETSHYYSQDYYVDLACEFVIITVYFVFILRSTKICQEHIDVNTYSRHISFWITRIFIFHDL